MRRTSYKAYIFLLAVLFFALSLSQSKVENIRSAAVACLSPSWQGMGFLKSSFLAFRPQGFKEAKGTSQELERLRQENQILHNQVESMQQWLLYEDRIKEQFDRLKAVTGFSDEDIFWTEFFKRRAQELCRDLDMQLQSLPAKVIFREPTSWSSTLWINVGEKNNEAIGKTIVAKNSPVVLGSSIVGVVEYVGKRHSRVRLITDGSLVPAVRALRGESQNHLLLEHVEALLKILEFRENLFSSQEEAHKLQRQLYILKRDLGVTGVDLHLAKGELHGSSEPLWRARGQVLSGVGFNYDFADLEGPERDLRSGRSLDPSRPFEGIPLLKVGDLLVTSGLDGVFPAGFRVASLSKILPLREGGCAYDIEAVATAGNLDDLTDLSVLPPLGFEQN